MFLFIDEGEEYKKKAIGGILVPMELSVEIEKELMNERITSKLFGEIKWTSVDKKYKDSYLKVLQKLFWDHKDATYHSCSYTREEDRYKAAYMLIRAVSWKIENHYRRQNCDPMYVLFDNAGKLGAAGVRKVREILERDSKFHLDLDFCNHGHSHVSAGLQVSDLITGAVATRMNAINPNQNKLQIIEELERQNRAPIGVGLARFPSLYEFKMHHFDLTRLSPGR